MRRLLAVGLCLCLPGCGATANPPAAPPSSSPPPAAAAVEIARPAGLAWAGGSLWVASAGGNEVVRVDPAAGRPVARIPVPGTPLRLAATDTAVWVAAFRAGRVLAIDLAGNQVVHDVEVGDQPEGVAVGFGLIWVVRQTARQLVRLDPWVTCTTGNEVVAVDERTMAVRGRVPVPGEPDGIRVTGADVRVVATTGPTLVRLAGKPDAPEILDSRPLGDAPALADQGNDDLVPAGDTIAVSAFNAGRVYLAQPGR
jgi:hypothetical protein